MCLRMKLIGNTIGRMNVDATIPVSFGKYGMQASAVLKKGS